MQKSKPEIIGELKNSFDLLGQAGQAVPDSQFNISKNNKWTAAENIEHIARATKITSMAFTLPRFLHVLLYGKPNRTSHGYTKLVNNYEKKLEEGAQATGVYVPKKTNYDKAELLNKLKANGDKLTDSISAKWSEEQLDNYQVTHPILGLLTIRELAYFTIYHNRHHLETIRKYYL